MQQALTSVIDQLILECEDERTRLKEKKRVLEGVRSALATGQASADSSTEPQAKKSKKSKDDGVSSPLTRDDDAGKIKKKKEKKDPNKPKRASSAYNLFFLDYSKKYKADHPDIAQKDIMGIVGGVWKEMDAQKKAPYEARATVLKAEHVEAMAVYTGAPVASSSSAAAPAAVPAAVSSPVKVQVKAKVAVPTPTAAPDRKDSISSSGSSSGSSSSSSSDSEPEPEPVKKSKKSK